MQAGTITNAGGGFTDRVFNATAITTDSTFGYAQVSFSSGDWTSLTVPQGYQTVYAAGFANSGGTCAINGNTFMINYLNSSPNILLMSSDPSHCALGSGKIYAIVDYNTFATVNVTGTGCAGVGCGTGMSLDVISASGQIVYVAVAGSAESQPAPGQNYVVNDVVKITAVGDGTFRFRVDSVSTVTNNGGDQVHLTGCGALSTPGDCGFPHPEITVGSYCTTILGAGCTTTQGFLNAAIGQSKVSWNPQLTANSGLNPAVRTAFGVGGGGGGAAVRGLSLGKSLSIVPLLDWLFRPANDNKPRAFRKAA
jgi:hypothetical protein